MAFRLSACCRMLSSSSVLRCAASRWRRATMAVKVAGSDAFSAATSCSACARVAFGRASTGVQGHGGGTGSYARRVGIRLPRVGDWRRGPVCLIPGIVTTMRRNTGSLGQAAIQAPDLGSLVRYLALQASHTPDRPSSAAAQEAILDTVVDGIGCLLIRRAPQTEAEAGGAALSPREREIARMVAKGYPNKTIASVLDISSWTVATYLRRIFAKLRVTSRAAMVASVMEKGL